MKLEECLVETNHIRLHCMIAGEGPLLIFLHGFPECWYSWRHQLEFFAKNYRVVAVDLRGYNKSEKPKHINDYAIPILIKDVEGLIFALGETKANIIGHDWGGGIAWAFAMEKPECIHRLIIMNAPHPAMYLSKTRYNLRQLLKSWYVIFFQLPLLPEWLLSINHAWAVSKIISRSAIQKQMISIDDLNYLRHAASQPFALKSAINYYRAFLKFLPKSPWHTYKSLEDWPKIPAPTLLIWGEKDNFIEKTLTFGMEPLFANQFVIKYIPDSGHWVQQEQPSLVNQYISEFLNQDSL